MSFVVAGFGKFGHIAVKRLRNSRPDAKIVVVEQDAARLKDLPTEALTINGDAVQVIADSCEFEPEDIIIPMVPFNLAAEYVLSRRFGAKKTGLPEGIAKLVPNPYVVDRSTLACSRADFICPDDCPEGERCTVTGEPRVPLCDELRRISLPDCRILVQQSFQILPGVGGYSLRSLDELVHLVGRGKNVIATSCKCHAILTCIEAQ